LALQLSFLQRRKIPDGLLVIVAGKPDKLAVLPLKTSVLSDPIWPFAVNPLQVWVKHA